jgi:hypothetical protein
VTDRLKPIEISALAQLAMAAQCRGVSGSGGDVMDERLTQLQRVARGLEILGRHGGDDVYAEHDVIYAGGPSDIGADDAATLEALGWHWDDHVNSWARFV